MWTESILIHSATNLGISGMGGALLLSPSRLPGFTSQLLLDSLFFIYFPASLFEQHQLHLALFGSIQQSQRSQFNPLTYCVDSPDSIIAELCDHFRPAIGHCRPSSMGRKKRKEEKGEKTAAYSLYPLKAPGILQVEAKTNNNGLKSPLFIPCVITATASLHITKTREWRARSMHAF